jgi:hypothetical protein
VNDRLTVWATVFWRGVLVAGFTPTTLVALEASRAADTSVAVALSISASR